MVEGPTLLADVFDPDVWADLVVAEFKNRARVINWATTSDTLTGKPGSTVHFPKWDTLGEFEDLTEDEAMKPQKLTQTDGTATVKEAGRAFSFTDKAALNGLGDIDAEGVRQLGTLAARKIDADLIIASVEETSKDGKTRESKPLTATDAAKAKALSWDVIVDACALLGDEWEPDSDTGLFIRSEQLAQVMKDTQFISSQAHGQTVIQTGHMGTINGMPVIVTNRLPERTFRIIRRGALGLLYKRRPIIERDRDILGRKNVVTSTIHYAVKRLNDKGVITGTLSAAG